MQQWCMTAGLTGCTDCPACAAVVVVRLDVDTGATGTHGLLRGHTLAPARLADLACTHDQVWSMHV
jgi:hypothetical protein